MYLKRKYQVGGIVYTPYLPAQAGSPQDTAGSSASSKTEKISGTIKGEIAKLLQENGIPSDVSKFLNYANNFLDKSRSLSQFSLFGGDNDDYDMSDLIKVQQYVNDVKYNKTLRDEAVKQITKEAAGSEVAITDRGFIYAQNSDGKIVKVTPKEYREKSDSYVPLTNNKLLYLREHEDGLSFDTGILNDLQNSIGMQTITKYLRDTIKAFGSDKIGGVTTKDAAVKRGMEALVAAGPDGYYDFTDEKQLRDVSRALRYLYNGMSDNAKNLLNAKIAVEGGDPKDPNDISNLLLQALFEHTSNETTMRFDKQASDYDLKQTGKKGGSSREQLTQNNYLQQIGNKRLYRTSAAIVPAASQIYETGMMNVPVYSAGAPVDKSGKVLGKMSLSEFRQQAEATKAGDMSSITFGNRILKDNEYDLVMYDGNSEINIAMLPYTHDPMTGQIMPNFTLFTKFNEIQKVLKENPHISETELIQKVTDKGINWDDLDYDRETNTITIKDTMPFITFSAISNRDSMQIGKEMKPFLEHLENKAGKDLLQTYNNVINYGTANPTKTTKKINNFNTPERWDMYKGNVYIPMQNAARAMLLSGIGEYVPKSSMTDYAARVTAREQEAAMQQYYRENDPNYDVISQNIGKFR